MADDLDDDFVPDDAFDDGQEPDTESDHGEQVAQTDSDKNSKKRKRRLRDRERFKEKKRIKLASGNEDSIIERSVAEQSPDELADYLAALQSKAYGKLSVLELEDMRVPATSIADTTMWTDSRTLDNFPDFVAKVLPSLRLRLSQKSKSNGAPTLLFLAGAALRVADIYRALKDKRLRGDKGGEVAKLFARHFKVAEHVSQIVGSRCFIRVPVIAHHTRHLPGREEANDVGHCRDERRGLQNGARTSCRAARDQER
uniref:Uncharacterized protein n=1 Tax=Mycena chlorophos TaxID=658473 RepID=A0ABQ0MD23_MYCCL|nr:predicted protein [Mycena chlorophos]